MSDKPKTTKCKRCNARVFVDTSIRSKHWDSVRAATYAFNGSFMAKKTVFVLHRCAGWSVSSTSQGNK